MTFPTVANSTSSYPISKSDLSLNDVHKTEVTPSQMDQTVKNNWQNGRMLVTNPDGSKGYVKLDYASNDEQVFAMLKNGDVVVASRSPAQNYKCEDGSSYVSYSIKYSKDAIAVIHTHPDKNGVEPYPGPKDGTIPYNLGIPNYVLSSRGVSALKPTNGKGSSIDVRLITGAFTGEGSGKFNLAAYIDKLNKGHGDINADYTNPAKPQTAKVRCVLEP